MKRVDLLESARVKYCLGSDDNIEIDDNAEVSIGEQVTWVQAWVFIEGVTEVEE